MGETGMKFRVDSSSAPSPNGFDEAYVDPLGSVMADYIYNSLLTGRPYFLQMMDDLKIVELFIHSLNSKFPREPLTLDATGDAYSVAVRFKELDPEVLILKQESTRVLNWSALVAQGQEQWPIVFLMPSGALMTTE
jgi:hypothetical protein